MEKKSVILTTFFNLKLAQKLPNNFLLLGQKDSLKKVVLSIAKIIVCSQNTNCASTCFACQQITQQNYDYFFALHPDENKIKVESIDSLFEWTQYLNFDQQPKIYWISEIDKMTKTAANKILKFLEIVQPNCLGILTTAHPEKLLPTIRSRLQIFIHQNTSFHLLNLQEITGLKNQDCEILLNLNHNLYLINEIFIKKKYLPTMKLINNFFNLYQQDQLDEMYLWEKSQILSGSFWFFLELLLIRLKILLFETQIQTKFLQKWNDYYRLFAFSEKVFNDQQKFYLQMQNYPNEYTVFLFWLSQIIARKTI